MKIKNIMVGGMFMLFAVSFISGGESMSNTDNIYQFSVVKINGEQKNLSDYKGKVVLIVNTASKCGFTPQFDGLEKLYKKYMDKGFVILGFPSNQFANQDPGTNQEIGEFCRINYGVTFDMFEKIDVNGNNAHPLYKYLVNKKGSFLGNSIKWNFTKFLIDRNGQVIKRFSPQTEPVKIEKDIIALLND